MNSDGRMPSSMRKEKIVFIHGSLGGAAEAFAEQAVLRDTYNIEIVVRRGYALDESAPPAVDLARDAEDLIGTIADGAHLVGTSTGGMVAMMAAGRRPDLVRSLTLIEPPAFALAADQPEVRHAIDALKQHWIAHQNVSDRQFLRGFFDALRMTRPVPEHISPELSRAIALLKKDRLWQLDAPVGAIANAGFPKLIVAGGWSAAYDNICHRLSALLRAELHSLPGFGHAVQKAGAAFNLVLTRHVNAASSLSPREN